MGIANNSAKTKTLLIDAIPSNVSQVIEFVASIATAARCPDSARNQLSICVDEVFSNIAQYAYGDGQGKARIDVSVPNESCLVQVVFRDTGVAFNALEVEDPDVALPLEQRDFGGLGIFITKKMADEVKYAREGDYNVLTVVKKF